MKKLIPIVGAIAGFALLGFASSASAQTISIVEPIIYSGPGCPAGTATARVLPGGTSFAVIFDAFTAEAGPAVPLTESTKQCNLQIDVRYPEGYTFSVADIAWRGNALLESDVFARFRARYNFAGGPSVSDEEMLYGAYTGDFEVRSHFGVRAWAPCSGGVATLLATGTAQVNNLENRDQSGIVRAEQSDGTFKLICHVELQRC